MWAGLILIGFWFWSLALTGLVSVGIWALTEGCAIISSRQHSAVSWQQLEEHTRWWFVEINKIFNLKYFLLKSHIPPRRQENEKWKYGQTLETVWGPGSFDKVETTHTTTSATIPSSQPTPTCFLSTSSIVMRNVVSVKCESDSFKWAGQDSNIVISTINPKRRYYPFYHNRSFDTEFLWILKNFLI